MLSSYQFLSMQDIHISNIKENIIIFLLALVGIKEVVARFSLWPRNWILSKFFYGNIYEETLLLNAFRELEISNKEARRNTKPILLSNNIRDSAEKLIYLIVNYIYNTEIEYGATSATKINSKYYINTMDASHDKEDLLLMCELLHRLIESDDRMPDFIITPKDGNPILNQKYAEKYNVIGILSKNEQDSSYAKTDANTEPLGTLLINYEASSRLLKYAESRKRNVYGVVLDCNAAGGTQIFKMMDDFNSLLENINEGATSRINIEPVHMAYILFRPDNSIDIDHKFSEGHYVIRRYFDLNEDLKSELYKFKSSLNKSNGILSRINRFRCNSKEFLKSFKSKLMDKKLYKADIV